jgi:hypothetical protein
VVGCAAVPTMLRIASSSTHAFLPKQVLVVQEQWECAIEEGTCSLQCGRDRGSGLRALANETRMSTATPSLDRTWPISESRILEANYSRAYGSRRNNMLF